MARFRSVHLADELLRWCWPTGISEAALASRGLGKATAIAMASDEMSGESCKQDV